jgi:hypothetical protein
MMSTTYNQRLERVFLELGCLAVPVFSVLAVAVVFYGILHNMY